MHTHTHTHTHTDVCVCVCIYTCIHTPTKIREHICIYLHVYVQDLGGWRGPQGYVTPTAADAFVNAYRKWFDSVPPPPHAAHARDLLRDVPLDKEVLLDRYSQHTVHCSSCSGALKRAELAAKVCSRLMIAAATAVPWLISIKLAGVSAAATALAANPTWPAAIGMVVAMKPWLIMAAGFAALEKARQLAKSIAERLTTGLSEYPPPRNRAQGAKGAVRELRTVEQGRSA